MSKQYTRAVFLIKKFEYSIAKLIFIKVFSITNREENMEKFYSKTCNDLSQIYCNEI